MLEKTGMPWDKEESTMLCAGGGNQDACQVGVKKGRVVWVCGETAQVMQLNLKCLILDFLKDHHSKTARLNSLNFD